VILERFTFPIWLEPRLDAAADRHLAILPESGDQAAADRDQDAHGIDRAARNTRGARRAPQGVVSADPASRTARAILSIVGAPRIALCADPKEAPRYLLVKCIGYHLVTLEAPSFGHCAPLGIDHDFSRDPAGQSRRVAERRQTEIAMRRSLHTSSNRLDHSGLSPLSERYSRFVADEAQ
jgi:hypothetical protein